MTAKLDAAVSSSLVVGDGVAASKAAILEKFPVKRLVSTLSKMLFRVPNFCVKQRPFPEPFARRMSWSVSRAQRAKSRRQLDPDVFYS